MARKSPIDRFMSKVDLSGGADACWVWTKSMQGKYGAFYFEGRTVGAHRWSYEHHSGEKIPDGMEICHQCDNPPCVNPKHLKIGTHLDNMREVRERGNGPMPGLSPALPARAITVVDVRVRLGVLVVSGAVGESARLIAATRGSPPRPLGGAG